MAEDKVLWIKDYVGPRGNIHSILVYKGYVTYGNRKFDSIKDAREFIDKDETSS